MNNQGCVYFFRHVGLSPIKIGCTSESTPEVRLGQMKCFAPYGAEIVAYVNTSKFRELESFLHSYLKIKRLQGEWFEVSLQDIEQALRDYDVASKLMKYKPTKNNEDFYGQQVKKAYLHDPNFNRFKLAKELGISRKTVHKHLKKCHLCVTG